MPRSGGSGGGDTGWGAEGEAGKGLFYERFCSFCLCVKESMDGNLEREEKAERVTRMEGENV